ncbi:protein CHUP1, chloroplastic-like [Abrus precatorius]|uniref:Protein CHUP1, chloroplastic-like n=1 Tax=Abrus precatorius TaxID=3816 RepID=A0A8B8K488_ABRPR|nr:protein CHUP1, chloroplastic-like [Abrus precatorius]
MVAAKPKLSSMPFNTSTATKSSITRSFAAYFSRSSAQVQPRPSDVTDLLRLVEDLRERESRLKTELLEHKLLKETLAIVPILENEITARDAQIQTKANQIEQMEAENQRLRNELEKLKLRIEEEKTENQRKTKALEDQIEKLKKTASDHVCKVFENDEHSSSSSSPRLLGTVEVSVRSTIIKSVKKTTSEHGGLNQKQVEATVVDFKRELAENERPRYSRSDSDELADSTHAVLTRSRAPRVPKPPPRPSSSSLSYDSAAGNVETEQAVFQPSKTGPPLPPPPPKAASKAAPPPPPPLPKGSRQVAAKVRRVPEVVEFYHSLMKRESQSRREPSSGVAEMPPPANARDMIGEIENRSSHLLAIKSDVETQGDFIKCLIKEVEGAAFTDIEDVVLFVKWLDDELSYLVDERAVLKHFDWPEQKADALREAAFGYCDLKKLESEASSFRDDSRQPCGPALKKMQALLEKLEHGVYNISRMRESATKRYKVFQIPVHWMLDNGFVSQIKLASVKLAMKYMKRVSAELETVGSGPEEEELIVQGVRFAFRVHQFAGGFDVETMRAFQELRDKARSCHLQCHSQQQKFLCRSATC